MRLQPTMRPGARTSLLPFRLTLQEAAGQSLYGGAACFRSYQIEKAIDALLTARQAGTLKRLGGTTDQARTAVPSTHAG